MGHMSAQDFRPGDRYRIQYGATVFTAVVQKPVTDFVKLRLLWEDGTDDDPDYRPMYVMLPPSALMPVDPSRKTPYLVGDDPE